MTQIAPHSCSFGWIKQQATKSKEVKREMSFSIYFVQILRRYRTSHISCRDERLTQPKKIQIRGHVGGATMGGAST